MNSYTLLDILNNSVEYLKEEKEVTIELSGIKIPKIQRDYAQGREVEKTIRSRFLNAIFNHLVSEKETMDLDFIYGSLKVFDKKNYFTPLDGQQRITTLFLLNWYVANVELNGKEKIDYLEKLNSFSYETRPAAKNFCRELVNFIFEKNPIQEIENQNWFLDFYKQDPTISSMINMLENIDIIYKEHNKKLFSRLPSLRFYIMPLDGFNLSDELYIKMNARGKQLSDFENFKADLINWMKSEKNIDFKDFNTEVNYHSKKLPYYLSLASKFDNEWSDIFWTDQSDQTYDKSYLCFITRFFVTYFSAESQKPLNEIADSEFFKTLTYQKNNKIEFKYEGFEIFAKNLDFDVLRKLEKVLDNYSRYKTIINSNIFPLWDKNYSWKLYSSEIIPRQYDLFYGVVKYLELNTFDEEKFKDWIRFVWNLIIDPVNRSYPVAISLIKNDLSPYSNYSDNINAKIISSEFLAKFEKRIIQDSFQTSKLYEEVEKAKLILKNSESSLSFADLIYELESHSMFKGHIAAFVSNSYSYDEILKLRNAALLLCGTEKPINNKWVRATLILNDDLTNYILNKKSISLDDGRFENWNNLINNELRTGFYRLLKDISSRGLVAINSVISDYKFSVENLWLWNLVKYDIYEVDNETCYTLMDYSETMNLKKYGDNIYLFNQTIWTEGNVLLSSFRNQIISKLLEENKFNYNLERGNIQNLFFRGWKPVIYFLYKEIKISLIFKSKSLWIGVNKNDIELLESAQISWIDTDIEEDNIFNKFIIDFSDLHSLDKIDIVVDKINDFIANTYN